ncbi:hypothetical protein GmHk_01G002347 [Glycine max]|nr:hypothetical protein GmHk_01G002347 [Glycine max]
MQQHMNLLKHDQYIHWHRLKDEDVVHSTYKTNRYRLSLLDIAGVTPTWMTFSTAFAYLEGERLTNVVWALQRFRVKAKCKTLVGSSEQEFDEYLKKLEIVCSP